ncbi:hypothetical protein C5749_16520 [Sphingobacterium gobiense]|uniref:Signal transduction histidine kinase internal region domain-containing protein n=2 Tax=Sphingobacterium gobiense TaxID=1382456 RepID=A0A2S9JG20_9SPHI|nr:hypothetical protein C5749_16520 [Sphingobacterium gobiense]
MLLPNPEEQQFRDYVLDYIDFYLRFASIGFVLGGTEMFVNLLRERGKTFRQKRYDMAAKQKSKRLKRWITHFAGNITNGTVYSMKKQVHPQQVSASVAINGYIVRLLARENMFWVSLQEELYYLQRFREMFSIFPIQFKIPSETYQHQVMPLSLLVLYKNICKHGAFDTDAPAASFCVVASPDRLVVTTRNTISSDAMWVYNEGGTGLEQLRGLLLENHGDNMKFEYGMEGNRFWLRLEIVYNTELYNQMINNYGKKTACVTSDGSR